MRERGGKRESALLFGLASLLLLRFFGPSRPYDQGHPVMMCHAPPCPLHRWNATREGDGWRYIGWEATVAKLQDVFALYGPFDGIMGFSQVGSMF